MRKIILSGIATTLLLALNLAPADAQRMLPRQHADGHTVYIPECRDHACCKRNAVTMGKKYDAKFCAEAIKRFGAPPPTR